MQRSPYTKVWVDYIKIEVLEELQGIIKIGWKIVFSFFLIL